MPRRARVALLTGGTGLAVDVIAAELERKFHLTTIIREDREPRMKMIRRRYTRLGAVTVVDQLLFQTGVSAFLRIEARRRLRALIHDHRWEGACAVEAKLVHVTTVNSVQTREALERAEPDVIVICGTRILSKKFLTGVSVPIVNLHAGITPRYRGVHGAYWAMFEGRPDLAGVTVHRVDAGIDTGSILARATVSITPEDNFMTYPLLQLAAGLPLLTDTVSRLAMGERWSIEPSVETASLRYHPRTTQYLYRRWLNGVR